MNATPSSRPQSVTMAVTLLVLVQVIGLISTIYQSTHNAAMLSAMGRMPAMVDVMYVVWAVLFALELFFIYKIYQGRNWARITMLVLFVIGALFSIPGYLGLGSVALATSVKIVGFSCQLASLIAFIMLFSGQGGSWFRK